MNQSPRYINSGAETESELVTTLRRNKRRQRSRSRSPTEARAHRLPQELTKHLGWLSWWGTGRKSLTLLSQQTDL